MAPVVLGASESLPSAKASHVNMMTDTVIANMPPEGLRVILRGLLGVDAKVTPTLTSIAVEYLNATSYTEEPQLFYSQKCPVEAPALLEFQQRYRCLMGCGMGFRSMKLLYQVICQVRAVVLLEGQDISEHLLDLLAIVDADVVQSVTAVQKELLTTSGMRKMTIDEIAIVRKVMEGLMDCKKQSATMGIEFAFKRGLSRIRKVEGIPEVNMLQQEELHEEPITVVYPPAPPPEKAIEKFELGNLTVPRMFMGEAPPLSTHKVEPGHNSPASSEIMDPVINSFLLFFSTFHTTTKRHF